MEVYKEVIHEWIKQNRTVGVQLLQKLVQEASVQGNEKLSQAIVIEKCRELMLNIDIWEAGGDELLNHPSFVSPRKSFADSPNVVAVLKGCGGGKSIILNGHIDVVPEGDINAWTYDPFSGKVLNGRLFGRGASDMKGGNVSLLLALEAIIKSGIRLKGDVIFQSVIEEESGGAGTLATIIRGYHADGAIIPEPSNMKIFPLQQGSMWFRILTKGKSAHGGTRYNGVSAIEKLYVVLEALKELEQKRNNRITNPLYHNIPIPIPINVGKVYGGSWPSSVPDEVTIEGRMGVAPDESIEEAQSEMENWLMNLKTIDPWFEQQPLELEWFGARWLPGSIEIKHELLKTLEASYQSIKNCKPVIEASPWGTDAGLLTNIGNIPSIVFGPGTTEVAHYPDEYIELNRMFEAAEIIALTVIEWCGIESIERGE